MSQIYISFSSWEENIEIWLGCATGKLKCGPMKCRKKFSEDLFWGCWGLGKNVMEFLMIMIDCVRWTTGLTGSLSKAEIGDEECVVRPENWRIIGLRIWGRKENHWAGAWQRQPGYSAKTKGNIFKSRKWREKIILLLFKIHFYFW